VFMQNHVYEVWLSLKTADNIFVKEPFTVDGEQVDCLNVEFVKVNDNTPPPVEEEEPEPLNVTIALSDDL